MIKIVWSIKDINKYQTGNLPDNAIKIETPKSVDELMKKALPIAVILCVLLFAAMLGKTIVCKVVDLSNIYSGGICFRLFIVDNSRVVTRNRLS